MMELLGKWFCEELQLNSDGNMTNLPNCVFFMERGIGGIASVRDKIFVIRYKHDHISVYDSDTLREASHNIPVPDIQEPLRLAGCSYNNALYIGYRSGIHKVNLADNSITTWKISDECPQGLSVTAEHTLLATARIKSTIGKSGVKAYTSTGRRMREMRESDYGIIEYTSAGQRMREIRFDFEIQLPHQTLQLYSDQFIVCHSGGVCVVNNAGRVVKSIKHGRKEQFLEPCSIAMDDKSRRIFIAVRGNHKILMLNTDLRYLGQFHTPPEIRSPSHLCFDSTHGRLFTDSKFSWESCRCTIKTIQHPVMLCGVTVVGNEVFVIGDRQSQVSVYDSHSLTALRNIDIGPPDMKSPRGLAGCSYNNALYIIDQSWFIHRVDLANNFVTRWELKGSYEMPESLSVTTEHTLLVTVRMSDRSGGCGVVEYTSEGERIREIRFHTRIYLAWHTIQLSSDEFIVSQGFTSKERVCKIGANGQIKRFFGDVWNNGAMRGSEPEPSEPRSVASDVDNNCIFVADAAISKVLMLNTDLEYLGQVHIPPDFNIPNCLHFESSTQRLFVTEINGRLSIIGLPD